MKSVSMLLIWLLIFSNGVFAQQRIRRIDKSDSICIPGLSNRLQFYDYQHYLLIRNHISGQQYIYWKKESRLDAIKVDTNMVKRIYLDYLKDTAGCVYYMSLIGQPEFKPKVMSLCPYDDTTVLGCLETYRADTVIGDTRFHTRVYAIMEMGIRQPIKLNYVNHTLPVSNNCLISEIYADNRQLYFALLPDDDPQMSLDSMYNLARMKKRGSVYSVDKILPTTLNDYLVANNVYHNYNTFFLDNGYALMSLSNYVLNLETGEKIYLPVADSIFRSIRIDQKTFEIPYSVFDFKYNKAENKFYLSYCLDKKSYIASFRPNSAIFETNDFIYAIDGDFCRNMKNKCLSWDGTRVLYSMNGDSCFRYATVAELQQAAKEYKKEF